MAARVKARRRVAIVTGSRAEFGLLRPVIDAARREKRLEVHVIAAGSHFLAPGYTIREVEAAYAIAARVRMQRSGQPTGRRGDSMALARGIAGFARAFDEIEPEWVVVLGDRIEAFAAAASASIGGRAVCHVHGGDRAEGIADEAMRHAITKLAHLHCAASAASARRIVAMGERREHVHVTGSPAVDGLDKIAPMSARERRELGDPGAVVLVHPTGDGDESFVWAAAAGVIAMEIAGERPVLWLEPNHDAGREQVVRALESLEWPGGVRRVAHLARHKFIALLKAMASRGGALVGNSSAGLIEGAYTGIPVIDLGPRQAGRESHARVLSVRELNDIGSLARYPGVVRRLLGKRPTHPFGDGRAGEGIARLLAQTDPYARALLRKRNAY